MAIKRTAKEDCEIGGVEIKKGEGVIASNMSGNRDGEVFERADVFDIGRVWEEGRKELGFGWGEHRCIAEHLAKLEMRVAFETIFGRLGRLRLGLGVDEIEYTPLGRDVGVVKLPVLW